jgi:hypothetical protein
MATVARKSPRRKQLEAAIVYPLDWLEERSGLVGGVRYFLFRLVPRDTNWFHTLGSATLTAFLVQAITGVSQTRTRRTSRSGSSPTTSRSGGSSAACTAGARACSSS